MVQNLRSEHAIYYMFSNEHMNYLITYSFDFRNEELLSYYISFLRAISGKLNKNTISLLVKTRNDEIVSFPLYVEAIRFAFHEENMVRTAVRTVTLNVYHVGDDAVNRYITSKPHADYFSNLISFFRKQSMDFNKLVSDTLINPGPESTSTIIAAVDDIEDNLYYFSDIVSAGIPDVGTLITDSFLVVLIFPLLFPSLRIVGDNDMQSGVVTSLYLLCCILRILKIKELANTIAAALFYPLEAFTKSSWGKFNGHISGDGFTSKTEVSENDNLNSYGPGCSTVTDPYSSGFHSDDVLSLNNCSSSNLSLREVLLAYVTKGNDIEVLGSLGLLATLLQTKELDESMLDGLGILPQLCTALFLDMLNSYDVFWGGLEGHLSLVFLVWVGLARDRIGSELEYYHEKIKEHYGVLSQPTDVGTSPLVHRFQVIDALVSLFCRSNISAETLWDGGWLLRQLLPYSESEFNSNHLELLKVSYNGCASALMEEVRGIWSDFLVAVICEEWRKCKRAMESSSPRKEWTCMLLPPHKLSSEVDVPDESSFVAGERMLELVKVFVLQHQLQIFALGKALPEQPPIHLPGDLSVNRRAKTSGLDVSGPKPGIELSLGDAVPCRIAFERGKERHFWFLAISVGTSGWLVLAEELPLRQTHGVIRVAAPLAGCNPKIDDKHPKWLHLRIRPSSLPFLDPAKFNDHGKSKNKALVDGRWTLAFRDEESCKSAFMMIVEEMGLLSDEVHRRLKPLLNLEITTDSSSSSVCDPDDSCSFRTHTNSL
ncbi:hypothetical protein PIB30_036892 [Stylosanthes scabra]|uniref:FPL domain-containing protein n=1 Tax=Stylosanthes scabra TaxID=79078 RepID=A0ABU6YFZ5_9FABA|nr:hypothetical protein [Stylosanthes scabra]